MRTLLQLLWIAGFVQVVIASANPFLPAKLNYRENLVFAAVMIGFVIRLSSLAILLFRLIPRDKPLHGSGFVAVMEELSDR